MGYLGGDLGTSALLSGTVFFFKNCRGEIIKKPFLNNSLQRTGFDNCLQLYDDISV